MKKLVQRSLVVMMLLTASATASFAGAWTAPKNAFYEKLAFNFYYSNETFAKSGKRVDTANNGKFTDYNISNYFEYGLTDDLTVINALAYKWLEDDNNLRRTKGYGLGDVDLGLRYKLMDNTIGILSTQALVKIPGPYDRSDPLPLGNGQFDGELRLLYGRSLYPLLPAYGNVEIGYRWRASDPSDELRYLVEFGVDVTKALYGRLKLDGIYSIDNGNKFGNDGNPTTTNNFDLGKLDITVGFKITPAWGLEASYTPALYGQNTAAGATYSLAVFYKTP
jgi:hypothetical protein